MIERIPERRDYSFAIGLLTGTAVGAGLAMWLMPRSASELRQRAVDELTRKGNDIRDGVADAVDGLTRKGNDIRDGMADAVVRGAKQVERYATAAKTP